jgi:hypothetical protein
MEKIRNTIVVIGGILFLIFGLFHITFWFLFDWKNELIKLNEVNSNVMQMLNIGTVVILLSFGCIMLFYRSEILNTRLGNAILIISSLFFFARLIAEIVFPGSSIIFGLILFLCMLLYLIPAITKVKH